jgi:LPXTG-site transpeptidase (sortase) family protein
MTMTENTPTPASKSAAPEQHKFSVSAIAAYGVAAVGIVLIVVAGVYMYSRLRSGSDAGDFTYTVLEDERDSYLGRTVEQALVSPVDGETPIALELTAPDVAQFASLYPGDQLNPKYWSEPEWSGSDPFGGPTIPDEFIPVLSTDIFMDFDPSADATRIRIPSIKLDSTVDELGIVSLDEQASYQTPDNTVGHISETSSPGQQGSGWFFGHLESFVQGEGSIFRHLPEITELIKNDPVDVFIETEDAEYVYRVTSTSQLHESELHLSSADDAQITLVTCWPPRVYDHRILVAATLIAYRPL